MLQSTLTKLTKGEQRGNDLHVTLKLGAVKLATVWEISLVCVCRSYPRWDFVVLD